MKRLFILAAAIVLTGWVLHVHEVVAAPAVTCLEAAKTELGEEQVENVTCVDSMSKCKDANQKAILSQNDCQATYNTCCATIKAGQKNPSIKSASTTKGSSGSPTTITNPLGAGTTIFTIINRVVTAFLGMVGALALGVFIYAGVLWMTAGSSDRVQKAKDAMKYAVIGLAMIAFSYAITTFFLTAFTKAPPANQPGANVQEAIPLGE